MCPPDHVGCHAADVDFHHSDRLFSSVMLDSGWVPAGSPVQVRFALFLGGSTEVDLGGSVVTSWPSALTVAVPGRPGTGRLAMDYGFELVARIRIDVSIAGLSYDWEGDIPIPGGIPRDLRLNAVTTFDPFVLPLADARPVSAHDDTDVVRLFSLDITDSLIPLPGISGGFAVEAVASLNGTYQTEAIEITDAITDISEEGEAVVVRADPGAPEFGAAKDLTVLPHGTVRYDGTITLFPTLFVEIAGRTFDIDLAEVPLNIVNLTAETDFDPALVHVPLPDVRLEETELSFGELIAGDAVERVVTVYNDGEAELRVSVSDPSAPFAVTSPELVIAPGSSVELAVRFEPTAGGEQAAVLNLLTNDPDEPHLVVRLSGKGVGVPDAGWTPDAGVVPGVTIAGGCGCSSAGNARAPWLTVVLAALAIAIRRRRR